MENDVKVETVETKNTQEIQESIEKVELKETPEQETQENGKPSKEIVRELAKEFGLNLFDEEGRTMLKEKWGNTIKERDEYKSQVDGFPEKEQLFAQKEQKYQSKIEALGMGFQSDQIDEVIKLAKVYTEEGQSLSEGLKIVKEKYGMVFKPKNIGTQFNDMGGNKPDPIKSERDKYMQESKYAKAWNQNKN